jgi:hypothetical protein
MTSQESISRRDFLKLTLASLGSVPYMKFRPKERSRVWEIPTAEERMAMLADPEFFTIPPDGGKRRLLTAQYDPTEWGNLESELQPFRYSAQYAGNGCGISVLTSAVKINGFFRTGRVPDCTCADVVNFLNGKRHDNYLMIHPNSIRMTDDGLKWAADLLGKETGLFTTLQISPDLGLYNNHIIPTSDWASLFNYGKKHVLEKGGLLVARILKYSINPRKPEATFIIVSSMNIGGEPLIVDSVGPKINGIRNGVARTVALKLYAEKAPPGTPDVAGRPGLFSLIGIVPTF